MADHSYILGVDEAGRGPLAGPVTVAAVLLPRRFYFPRSLPPLRDSKKLTALQREGWFEFVEGHGDILYEVSSVGNRVIDRINVAKATNRAARRAVERLIERNGVGPGEFNMYVDGLIDVGADHDFRMVVRGDDKINAIKLASVMAKVTRDRRMGRIHKKYEEYGFDRHKGYGTAEHKRMVKRHGPSEVHRLTFLHL